MTDHLSPLQIEQLGVSALPGDELAVAAVHAAVCQLCHQRFVEELKRQQDPASFNFTLEPEFWFRNDHVDFDQLVAMADETLDETTEEIINLHLKTCERCREDVRSFLAFRPAPARDIEVSDGRTSYQPAHDVKAAQWWQRLSTTPVYAVAAIVLVAIAVLIALIALNTRSGSFEVNKQDQSTPGSAQSPNISPSLAPNVVSTPSSVNDSVKVAIVNDRGGEVTIDKNGRVTGLDEVSENSRQLVARATLSEQIPPADVLRRLSGEQSGLRGDDNGEPGFRLLYPARRVVTEDRPVFRWEGLSGVSSYRVYVLDENGDQVGQSEELPSGVSQWKASAPLRRGQVFSWAVTALVDGKQVISPSASAPEMKFAVLSAEDFQELNRLKKSNSHLALGVFYARVGLLDQAEREFENLVKLNPQSALPQKLLQSTRSIRKPD